MAFVMEWFWYLLAFVSGSALAWGATVLLVKHTSADEALADLPGSREIGGQE
jgi:uncharacterized membrane protein ArfB